MSTRKSAEARLSRACTMVWFSLMAMRRGAAPAATLPEISYPARHQRGAQEQQADTRQLPVNDGAQRPQLGRNHARDLSPLERLRPRQELDGGIDRGERDQQEHAHLGDERRAVE